MRNLLHDVHVHVDGKRPKVTDCTLDPNATWQTGSRLKLSFKISMQNYLRNVLKCWGCVIEVVMAEEVT